MKDSLFLYLNVNVLEIRTWRTAYNRAKRILSERSISSTDFKETLAEKYPNEDYLLKKSFFSTKNARNRIKADDDLSQFQNTFPVVIINGLTTERDFQRIVHIVHFLNLKNSERMYFGFNLSGISSDDPSAKTRLRFSLNQFLFPFIDSKKHESKFFFIDGKYGKVSLMAKSQNEILRRFTPLLDTKRINIFESVDIEDVRRIRNNKIGVIRMEYESRFKINYSKLSLKSLILRRLVDLPGSFKSKLSGNQRTGRSVILNVIIRFFDNQPALVTYLFLLYYEIHLVEETLESVSKHLSSQKVSSLLTVFRQYYYGLKEIIENTRFHANGGYIFISTNKYSDIAVTQSEPGLQYYRDAFYQTEVRDDTRLLEISVLDSSNRGILDTYKDGKADVQLRDLFTGTYIDDDSSHLNLRYASHLGLKSFTKTVLSNNGYFKVQTIDRSNSILCSEFLSTKGEFQNEFDSLQDGEPLPGTSYRILLLFEHFKQGRVEHIAESGYEHESVSETLINWLNYPEDIPFLQYSEVKLKSSQLKSKKDQITFIREFGDQLLDSASANDTICLNYHELDRSIQMDYNLLVKILSYIQLSSQSEAGRNIVVFNCSSDTIKNFMLGLEVMTLKGAFWNEERYLYLYDQEGVPFIINGQHKFTCFRLNKKVKSLYQGRNYWLSNTEVIAPPNFTFKKQVIPFELIIEYQNEDNARVTIFDHYVNRLLDKNLVSGDLDLGLKIPDAFIKLGAKIIATNFYEANILFKKSFFVDRYAFYLSRDVIKAYPRLPEKEPQNSTELVLLGYADYSELLVNRVKYFIRKASKKTSVKVVSYFICEDDDQLNWRFLNKKNSFFNNRSQNLPNHSKLQYLLVVPLSSTFTTNQKMVSSFNDNLTSLFPNDHQSRISVGQNLKLNFGLIFLRDFTPEAFYQPTEKEKEFITEITTEKKVHTQFFIESESGIRFYSYSSNDVENRNWQTPLNLIASFPPDSKLHTEKPVSVTNKTSLSPHFLIGWPKIFQVQRDSSDDINFDRIQTFQGYLKEGPILNGKLKQIYYIDTERYIDDRNKMMLEWLSRLSRLSLFQNDDSHHVIVSVSKGIQLEFVHLVNDYVFKNKASVISFDFQNEFRDNIIHKYNYLRHYINIRFHFVDHVLNSGDSFYKTVNYLSSVLDCQVNFESILVLINRLSKYRLESILDNYIEPNKAEKSKTDLARRLSVYKSSFHSFVDLYVPPVRNPDTFCFITQRQNFYLKVSKKSNLDIIRHYLSNKSEKLRRRNIQEVDVAYENRYFDRLQLTHKIYYEISQDEVNHFKNAENILINIWGIYVNDAYDKINIIKVFSSPPLSHYHEIRKFILPKMLIEIDSLLDQPSPNLKDFSLLVCLIKQLTYLNSNFIIRKNSINRIWRFYFKVRNTHHFYFINNNWIDKTGRNRIIQGHVYRRLMSLCSDDESKNYYHSKLGSILESLNQDNIRLPFDRPVQDRVNLIIEQLQLSQVDLKNFGSTLAKSITNLLNFSILYTASIKQLIFNDQSKSYWLEYLMRTGNEIRPDKNGYKFETHYPLLLNKPYNALYKLKDEFNKDFEDPESLTMFSRFLVMTFLENTAILQKGFKHIKDINKYDRRKSRSDNLKSIKILFSNELLKEPYFFRHFKRFFDPSKESKNGESLVSKMSKLILLQSEMDLENNLNTLEKQVQIGLSSLRDVMEADHAIFCVYRKSDKVNKGQRNKQEINHSSRSNLYALVKCDKSLRLKNSIEFSPFSETFEFFENSLITDLFRIRSEKEETELYEEYNYSPNSNESEEFKKAVVTVLRLFVSKNTKVQCGIVFLNKGIQEEDTDQLKVRLKENIRLILLIKNDLNNFLERNYNNDNFRVLLSELEKKLFLRASTHGATNSLDIIKRVVERNIRIENRNDVFLKKELDDKEKDYLEFVTEHDSLTIRSLHRYILTNLSYSESFEKKIEILTKFKIKRVKLDKSRLLRIKKKIETLLSSEYRGRERSAKVLVTSTSETIGENHFFDLIEDFILELTDNAKKYFPKDNLCISAKFEIVGDKMELTYQSSSRGINERLLVNLNRGHYEKASGALNLINVFVTKILEGDIVYSFNEMNEFIVKIRVKRLINDGRQV